MAMKSAIFAVGYKSASHKCVWRVSGHEFVSNRTGIFRFLAPKPENPGLVGHNFVSGQTSGRRSQGILVQCNFAEGIDDDDDDDDDNNKKILMILMMMIFMMMVMIMIMVTMMMMRRRRRR